MSRGLQKSYLPTGTKYSNYKDRREKPDLNVSTESLKMMIKTAACLLAVSFLAACSSTNTTKRETLREMTARYASNDSSSTDPMPPAEGPEEVASGPMDPTQNPALVPSPLLRAQCHGRPVRGWFVKTAQRGAPERRRGRESAALCAPLSP